MGLKKVDLDRSINRILYEIDTIKEEGINKDKITWYAKDRLQSIADIAQASADGDADACIIGMDVLPSFFDKRD